VKICSNSNIETEAVSPVLGGSVILAAEIRLDWQQQTARHYNGIVRLFIPYS
jgi:hypothetical protein